MKDFDQYIENSIAKEDIPMPKHFHAQVENTLSDYYIWIVFIFS